MAPQSVVCLLAPQIQMTLALRELLDLFNVENLKIYLKSYTPVQVTCSKQVTCTGVHTFANAGYRVRKFIVILV